MATVETLIEDTEEKMMGAIEALERDFNAYRTGTASPSLVDGLMVDYYGTQTRLRDIAGITTPEPRLLVIQPWDQNAIKAIEKAIQTSEIGISPQNDGRVIRLPIPELTEERRKDLGKQIKKRAEDAKVAVRNLRRDGNEAVKKYRKSSDITEDDQAQMLKQIQDLTNSYSKDVDDLTGKKEKDIMSI
jgi:ribosome recycling factor